MTKRNFLFLAKDSEGIMTRIKKLAKKEDRSAASMARVLLIEALNRRAKK